MNPNAFKILNKYRLPCPQLYSLEDVLSDTKSSFFYIRFCESSNKTNAVVSKEYIKQNIELFDRMISTNELINIESVYKSIGGGVSIVKNNFCYTEYVHGHLIMLVRRGRCGLRHIKTLNEEKFIPVNQAWIAAQEEGFSYSYKYFNTPNINNELKKTISDVNNFLPKVHKRGLLVEWLYTSEGIVFCDARENNFDEFGNELIKLLNSEDDIVLYINKNEGKKRKIIIDSCDFDVDEKPNKNDLLHIYNSAILSHYITKYFSETTSVILKKR